MVGVVAGRLGRSLGHVAAPLGRAIIAVAGAVVDLAAGVYPTWPGPPPGAGVDVAEGRAGTGRTTPDVAGCACAVTQVNAKMAAAMVRRMDRLPSLA